MTMFSQDQVNQWFAANPNATPETVAQTVQNLGGLEANQGLAGMIGQHYGMDAAGINNAYNSLTNAPQTPAPVAAAPVAAAAPAAPNYDQIINNAYAGIGRTGIGSATSNIDQGGFDYWKGQLASGAITPDQFQNTFNNAVDVYKRDNPTDPYTQYVNQYQQTQADNNLIKDYVSNVLADKTLTPWEQTNKIMERAQQANIGQDRLESIYGKDVVAPYLATYKQGINDYINKALATDPTKTTFDEVAQIHQAANKYGLTPDEIAKYGGMDPKTAQSYFDMYNQGLGTIVANMADPKTNDLTKTQTALALQQKYGTTDAEIAKASNGKYTEKDVKAYLDPVRNVPTNLQKLFDDPNATAADITKFINDAKADPRAAGIYGAALDKVASNTPSLYLRDAVNGNNPYDSAQKFLATAQADPNLAKQYAPQIAALNQIMQVTDRARNKDFGGTLPDYAMEMFLGLDKKAQAGIPKQLETSTVPAHTETRSASDDSGNYNYDVTIPAKTTVKTPGGFQKDEDEEGNVLGYSKKVDSGPFKNLYARYDSTGTLTGYDDRSSRVHVSDPQYYYAKFDANGKAIPGTGANRSGGFFSGMLQDVASMGPVGAIALAAATGGLGSLAAEALGGGLLANAAGSGLASGLLTNVAGGDFGKGFMGGAVGGAAGNLVGSALPTEMTGNPMIDSYLTKALPNLASAEARGSVMGQDLDDLGLTSLLNTGVNMGTNALINQAVPNTLPAPVQNAAAGIGSGLITSAITGKPINVQNSILNYALKNAMNAGRT